MSVINWSNVTSFGDMPAQANVASGSFPFWVGVIMLAWVVMFLMLIYYGFEVALTVSTFIALILSILLVYAGLIAWYFILFFAALLLFMFLYINWSSSRRV